MHFSTTCDPLVHILIFKPSLYSSVVLFDKVIPAGSQVNHGLVIPWLTFYCVASIFSLLVIVLKSTLFIEQLRERRAGLDLLNAKLSGQQTVQTLSDDAVLEIEGETTHAKHHKRLVKTHRRIYRIYATMVLGVVENVPMGILQGELT